VDVYVKKGEPKAMFLRIVRGIIQRFSSQNPTPTCRNEKAVLTETES